MVYMPPPDSKNPDRPFGYLLESLTIKEHADLLVGTWDQYYDWPQWKKWCQAREVEVIKWNTEIRRNAAGKTPWVGTVFCTPHLLHHGRILCGIDPPAKAINVRSEPIQGKHGVVCKDCIKEARTSKW